MQLFLYPYSSSTKTHCHHFLLSLSLNLSKFYSSFKAHLYEVLADSTIQNSLLPDFFFIHTPKKHICFPHWNTCPLKMLIYLSASYHNAQKRADKQYIFLKKEFPGGLVVRMQHFHCRGLGSIPGWGTEIPQATQHSQNKNKKKKKQTKSPINFSGRPR